MKKILIIADGILAKHFLEKIISLKGSENLYTFLAYRDKTLPKGIMKKHDFHFFDPTSFAKLSTLIEGGNFYQIMIVMSKKQDVLETYKNIRLIDKDVAISFIDRWGINNFEDANLSTLQSKEVLVSRFADFLPDRPVTARNVGLGIGEVMEVQVPVGSSFLYRHLASIEQKQWKIVAIYREKELILARPTLMIRPSDSLLLIGEPNVLLSVYKSIKQELGQFPYPFGSNIYTLIDMKHMNENEINMIINDAMLLHAKLNSEILHIKIVNPSYSKVYDKIKTYETPYIAIDVEFHNTNVQEVLKEDISKLDVGLVVVNAPFFKKYKHVLYKEKLPVFKIGIHGFLGLEFGAILATNSKEIERESSVILDFCSQLDLEIDLYDFDPDQSNDNKDLIKHFEHLSKLFEKEVNIIQNESKNPILSLKSQNNFIQFVPFHEKIIEQQILDIFSTDMDKLSYKLDNNYQLFIPAEE